MKLLNQYSLFIILVIFSSNCLASDITQNDLATNDGTQIQQKTSMTRECAISVTRAAFLSGLFTGSCILTDKIVGARSNFSNSDYFKIACGLTCFFIGMDIGHEIAEKYKEHRETQGAV